MKTGEDERASEPVTYAPCGKGSGDEAKSSRGHDELEDEKTPKADDAKRLKKAYTAEEEKEIEEGTKRALCSYCDKSVPKMCLYPDQLGQTGWCGWQGCLRLTCQDCYISCIGPTIKKDTRNGTVDMDVEGLSGAAWNTITKQYWSRRKGKAGQFSQKYKQRLVCWRRAVEEIDADIDNDGLSSAARKEQLKAAAKSHFLAFSSAILACSKEELQHLDKAFRKLFADADEVSVNAFFIPELDSDILADWQTQYVDALDKNGSVWSFFICRKRDCLYAARAVDWLNADGGRFWCPKCVSRYRPWKPSPQYCKSNKIMVYKQLDPSPSTDVTLAQISSFIPTTVEASDGAQYNVVPYLWLDTGAQGIENAFKEVAASFLTELRSLPEEQRLRCIMETTRKLPHPSFFHYEKPSTEDMQRARTVNMQSGKDQPCGKFNLERFEQDGWYGASLQSMAEELDHPLSHEELVKMWLMVRLLIHNAQLTMEDVATTTVA